MSTTWTSTHKQAVAVIGELDEVALLNASDGWPIGTTGTVVAVSSTSRTIEIRGYLGEALDFLDVSVGGLRLVRKCPEPDLDYARSRAIEAAAKKRTPLPIGEHDVVAFRVPIDGWPVGTSGTVISEGPKFKTVEISNHLGEGLAFLNVPPDQLRVVWRTARRGSGVAVD
jgi:hypothetical protein